MLQMNVYHFLSKLLKNVSSEEGEKQEKRQSRPRRQNKKRDFDLPETQTGFSMADLFSDISVIFKEQDKV